MRRPISAGAPALGSTVNCLSPLLTEKLIRVGRNIFPLGSAIWAMALMNVAINDSLVASFLNKYHYNFWRPETAIHAGDTDGNPKTDPDPSFVPFVTTPCFPSYPSNHGSASNGAAEILKRIYGEGGHFITLSNPAVPDIVLQYTTFKQITDDISDARVYGGIHFRTDQDAGERLGKAIGNAVYKNNLRRMHDDD